MIGINEIHEGIGTEIGGEIEIGIGGIEIVAEMAAGRTVEHTLTIYTSPLSLTNLILIIRCINFYPALISTLSF